MIVNRSLKNMFFLYTELKRFEFGKEWYQKNQLNVCLSCLDISWGDIPWNWWGKGLRAWPLCLKLIIWYVLKGFVSKIDAAKVWKKFILRCPHMINGIDLRRPPLVVVDCTSSLCPGALPVFKTGEWGPFHRL